MHRRSFFHSIKIGYLPKRLDFFRAEVTTSWSLENLFSPRVKRRIDLVVNPWKYYQYLLLKIKINIIDSTYTFYRSLPSHIRRQHWKSISFQYREVNLGFVPSGCSIWISKMWKRSSVTGTRISGPYHFALYLLAGRHLHILHLIQ